MFTGALDPLRSTHPLRPAPAATRDTEELDHLEGPRHFVHHGVALGDSAADQFSHPHPSAVAVAMASYGISKPGSCLGFLAHGW